MSAFLYYFPGAAKPAAATSDIRAECNLASVLGDAGFSHRGITTFPLDGTNGYLIAVTPGKDGKAAKCGYYPDAQVWCKVRGADGKVTHWIGYEKASPPGPADLARPEMVDGYPVKLADKREWVIPCVHVPLTTLPRIFRPDENGEADLSVASQYDDVCKMGAQWFEDVGSQKKFVLKEYFEFTAALLAINYRLGQREILELGLISDASASIDGILGAALGFNAIMAEIEAQKKSHPDTPSVG